MQLSDVLSPDRITVDLTASSKKTLLEHMACLLAKDSNSADEREIFESLCQRERLGSTGLGHGVAIPHGRNAHQKDLVGALVKLKKPVNFDAPDHEPVDLLFALALPSDCSDGHLKLLANLAEFFKNASHRSHLRQASHPDDILALLSDGE